MELEEMEFDFDENEPQTLKELYKNRSPLPIYLNIRLGSMGTCRFNEIPGDSVLRINDRIGQRRVLARVCEDYLDCSNFFSIPADYSDKIRVTIGRHNKTPEKTQQIKELLETYQYPIQIELKGNTNNRDHGSSVKAKLQNRSVTLLTDYEEQFFLCNTIYPSGEIEPISFLLAVSTDIDYFVISGIKGKPPGYFQKFKVDHMKIIRDNQSNLSLAGGNPDIAIVTREETGSGNDLPEKLKAFILPGSLCRPPPQTTSTRERALPSIPTPQNCANSLAHNSIDVTSDDVYTYVSNEGETADDRACDESDDNDYEEPDSPVLSSKEIHQHNDTTNKHEDRGTNLQHIKREIERQSFQTNKKMSKHDRYVPIPHENNKVTMETVNKDQETVEWIKSLSVQDVLMYLKKLGLGKYSKKFKHQKIDGVILSQLNEEILKGDFKLSPLEVIKLRSFIGTGHVPQ